MELQIADALLVAIVVGSVEIIKRAVLADSRFYPALALVLGVAGALLLFPEAELRQSIIKGLVCGLMAAGVWDNTAGVVETHRKAGREP